MTAMIWIGAALTLLGLVGIVYSIVIIARAKRAAVDDDALRAQIARMMPINLGALFVSMIGLMTVITGVVLS